MSKTAIDTMQQQDNINGINGARGGDRTRTPLPGQRILSPIQALDQCAEGPDSLGNQPGGGATDTPCRTRFSDICGYSDSAKIRWSGDHFKSDDGAIKGHLLRRGETWTLYVNGGGWKRSRISTRTGDIYEAKRFVVNLIRPRKERKSISQDCRFGGQDNLKGGSASIIGALAEYSVVCDLMAQGFEVYRAASPVSSCDLIVLIGGRALRVEVKCGDWDKEATTVSHPWIKNPEHFDVLAVYSRRKRNVLYRPSIEQALNSASTSYAESAADGLVPQTNPKREPVPEKERAEKRREVVRGPSRYFSQEEIELMRTRYRIDTSTIHAEVA